MSGEQEENDGKRDNGPQTPGAPGRLPDAPVYPLRSMKTVIAITVTLFTS